ncbi:MAG: IS110 family transposase [Desulfuromonas sp.]|nr:MAG: IS110 family transposase [Desulfuromonas sp.]
MAKFSLSSLQAFVSGFEQQPFWIGIDVHKRSYYIALKRSDGQSTTWVAPASPQKFAEQILHLGICVAAVAYETGPTGFSLARSLEQAGIPVIVAAASRIPRSVTAGAKCDRLDCLKLADYAAKGMLKPIAVPTPEEEARRSLIRRRHNLVDAVRRCKQRIKSMLLFLGLSEPVAVTNWTKDAQKALQELDLEPLTRLTLESYMRELTFHQTELCTVATQLKEMVTSSESCQSVAYLQTVPGVGSTVATSFALELFRPDRFRRAEEVASYLGLAPVVRHSGGKTPSGRLVPVGQKRLRSLLIEAAWMWKARDAAAADLYNRLVSRTGIAQKAIVAVARRLAIVLWRLMVEQRPYRMAIVTP